MATPYSTGITPEATAAFIEAIAKDKAARIKAVSRCAVLMMCCPEWMRKEEVAAYFGLPLNQLTDMVVRGDVTAKKLDRFNKRSAVIFKVADIRKAIDKLEPYDEWMRTRPDLNDKNTETTETQGE